MELFILNPSVPFPRISSWTQTLRLRKYLVVLCLAKIFSFLLHTQRVFQIYLDSNFYSLNHMLNFCIGVLGIMARKISFNGFKLWKFLSFHSCLSTDHRMLARIIPNQWKFPNVKGYFGRWKNKEKYKDERILIRVKDFAGKNQNRPRKWYWQHVYTCSI